jgi:hypothetical protein
MLRTGQGARNADSARSLNRAGHVAYARRSFILAGLAGHLVGPYLRVCSAPSDWPGFTRFCWDAVAEDLPGTSAAVAGGGKVTAWWKRCS